MVTAFGPRAGVVTAPPAKCCAAIDAVLISFVLTALLAIFALVIESSANFELLTAPSASFSFVTAPTAILPVTTAPAAILLVVTLLSAISEVVTESAARCEASKGELAIRLLISAAV